MAQQVKKEDEAVNPKHYAALGKYAAVYVISAWDVGFEVGNALKYIQRAGTKAGEPEERDIEKAIWYLRRRLHLIDPERFEDPAA